MRAIDRNDRSEGADSWRERTPYRQWGNLHDSTVEYKVGIGVETDLRGAAYRHVGDICLVDLCPDLHARRIDHVENRGSGSDLLAFLHIDHTPPPR